MSFTVVAVATSIAAGLLGIGWLFAGSLLLKRWRAEVQPNALLVGRRLGAVYLGMAVLLFAVRNAPASEMRTGLCLGLFIALVLLALLGVFEFKAGRVGKGILASVVLEVLLAAGFASVLLAS